ncbi:hypothetical protein ES319_D13G031400v1 [Gossypium barbadense]|uniref:Embryo surrounding factor 1 brassicaceae domain-containing protein n=4 Tax=Gossypium TaxID=3633 RepID=A0A5J5NHE0_GOSBA|nr:hypothetical protein ES319_D13G031400v1 [Gossypium barbadense]TYG36045.1 hypothetical protein ES288_D13G032800v1 [Gossypium darwinii]
MVATKFMATRLAFLLLLFTSLPAFHECSRSSSIHGNELDPGSKITLGPCSHRPCPTSGPASGDGIFRSCWCCISRKSECYTVRADCEKNCPLGPPPDLPFP